MNTELLDTLLCSEDEILCSTGCGSSTPVSGPSSSVENEATSSEGKPNSSPPPTRRPLQSFNALLISKLMAIANLSCKTGKKFVFLFSFLKKVMLKSRKKADVLNSTIIILLQFLLCFNLSLLNG